MSFEGLVGRISPTLKKIARKLNGHHTFFSDEDLYQEAIIHLWISFNKGTILDKTDSYILQGCYFHLRNYLRTVLDPVSFVSLNAPLGEDGVSLEEYLPLEDTNYFEYIMSKVDMDTLETNHLTPRECEILHLFIEGMSMREIGSKLGISHMMVWKIRNRIKDKYEKFTGEVRQAS